MYFNVSPGREIPENMYFGTITNFSHGGTILKKERKGFLL